MCLYIKSKDDIKIAKKNIRCFKVVEKHGSSTCTPYRFIYLEHDVLRGKRRFEAYEPDFIVNTVNDKLMAIEGGAIHTYKRYKDAAKAAQYCMYPVIYKCIIPKGTRYAEGEFGCCIRRVSFASRCIKFRRKLHRKINKL